MHNIIHNIPTSQCHALAKPILNRGSASVQNIRANSGGASIISCLA